MARKAKNSSQPELFATNNPTVYPDLPEDWLEVLRDQFAMPYWQNLQQFVEKERETHQVFPPADEVYTAFHLTPFHSVKVFLLGQDPYPNPGQGHGLCFSVKPGVAIPASLRNMYRELHDDLGLPVPKDGYLAKWAKQGMLMLNAVLTVRAGEANSHKNKGWEIFTDAVIKRVNEKPDPVVFVLWGAYAQKRGKLLDRDKHVIIESAHPSPLSAHAGFFGSKPYSRINDALNKLGHKPIDWTLTN